MCLLIPCVFVHAQPADESSKAMREQWKTDLFPISFWCGPPPEFVNEEQYQRIKDAGFTHIMPSCSGGGRPEQNQKVLDMAAKVGLKAFIHDSRIPIGVPDDAAKQRIRIVANNYKKHPALAGYHLTDEPGAGAFPALAQTVAALREADPEHVSYINLFPNYAPPHALGTETYHEHVDKFLQIVKPAILSYDHYHFLNGADRPGFFDNLQVVRELALQYQVPFWQIVLLIDHHGAYRRPSEAEKRWEAMQTLAFGGKGLMWFTYWRPWDDPQWGEAMINTDGTPTAQYAETQRINKDVQTLGKYLLPAKSTHVFQYGQHGDTINTGNDLLRFDGPNLTVGVFEHQQTRYVLFTNRDYRSEVMTTVWINTGGAALEKLDKANDQWQPASGDGPAGGKVRLQIGAGDGDLYRWIAK
jgi:hypothetical protein